MASKPQRTSTVLFTAWASLPDSAEPPTRPATMGMNIHPNAVSGRRSSSKIKCGADAMYRAKPPKAKATASERKRKARWRKASQ
ncbi:hypothetical protein D3C81_1680910 [compost metagenome]